MMCSQRPSTNWMKSPVMSASHRAREEIQDRGEHEARDHGAPQRIERIFHVVVLHAVRGAQSLPRTSPGAAQIPSGMKGLNAPLEWRMSEPHPYARLTPDVVLNAIETLGLRCDGRLLALNSYENRVYQVGIEPAFEASPGTGTLVVAKFYRPDR